MDRVPGTRKIIEKYWDDGKISRREFVDLRKELLVYLANLERELTNLERELQSQTEKKIVPRSL